MVAGKMCWPLPDTISHIGLTWILVAWGIQVFKCSPGNASACLPGPSPPALLDLCSGCMCVAQAFNVLHYENNQHYDSHFDTFDPKVRLQRAHAQACPGCPA